jgi:hypothetical protein
VYPFSPNTAVRELVSPPQHLRSLAVAAFSGAAGASAAAAAATAEGAMAPTAIDDDLERKTSRELEKTAGVAGALPIAPAIFGVSEDADDSKLSAQSIIGEPHPSRNPRASSAIQAGLVMSALPERDTPSRRKSNVLRLSSLSKKEAAALSSSTASTESGGATTVGAETTGAGAAADPFGDSSPSPPLSVVLDIGAHGAVVVHAFDAHSAAPLLSSAPSGARDTGDLASEAESRRGGTRRVRPFASSRTDEQHNA